MRSGIRLRISRLLQLEVPGIMSIVVPCAAKLRWLKFDASMNGTIAVERILLSGLLVLKANIRLSELRATTPGRRNAEA
jgi:hypothetical protein